MKIIGKNRKILSNNFDDLKGKGQIITFDVGKILFHLYIVYNTIYFYDLNGV